MTHTHVLPLSFLPGVEPKKVELTHAHATKPEEPHKHRMSVNLHTEVALTIKEES